MNSKVTKFADTDLLRGVKMRTTGRRRTTEKLQENLVRQGNKLEVKIQLE